MSLLGLSVAKIVGIGKFSLQDRFHEPYPNYRDESPHRSLPQTGIGVLWLFITLLVLVYCLYANHRERRERQEMKLESLGQWKGNDLEMRYTAMPATRVRPEQPTTRAARTVDNHVQSTKHSKGQSKPQRKQRKTPA